MEMIIESRTRDDDCETKNCLHLPTLMIMSVATSIDALAVGLSFAFLGVTIIMPSVIIGSGTFVLCLAGVYIGNRTGHFFEGKLELAGGIVLILIGAKIAVEHIVKHV